MSVGHLHILAGYKPSDRKNGKGERFRDGERGKYRRKREVGKIISVSENENV